jgi:hypothetical protein
MKEFKCKIDSHIPNETGSACECGYFIQRPEDDGVSEDINRKDGIYESNYQ